MNKVILIGRIGKAPEAFTFENGGIKTSFSLATSESYKDKQGEWKEMTEWHNIVMYKETRLQKGDLISVEGKIKTRMYEKDGVKKYITEIVAHSVKLLSRTKVETRQPEPVRGTATSAGNAPAGDDLPWP